MTYTQRVRAEIDRIKARNPDGPAPFEGRQRNFLTALRHGVTGQTVVMPADDLEAYQAHVQRFVDEYHPQGATETHLVQFLADAAWRIHRVAVLETNLLTHDIIYEDFPNHEATHDMRESIAIVAALDKHTKALANLSMHGQRLSRQFEKTLALLEKLQSARREKTANPVETHRTKPDRVDGFVFSNDEIEPRRAPGQRLQRAAGAIILEACTGSASTSEPADRAPC